MATSLLFNPDKGILHFLRRSLDKKVHGDAKVIFLEFTAEYLTRSPATMPPFIVDIKVKSPFRPQPDRSMNESERIMQHLL